MAYDRLTAEELSRFKIDRGLLDSLPKGRMGSKWPPAWRVACEVLYVNGFTPSQIEGAFGDGPDRAVIYDWAERGGWLTKRDRYVRETAEAALAATRSSAAEVIQRHVKELQAAQAAAMRAIINRTAQPKSLEGVISALVTAIRTERQVLGITDPQGATTPGQVNVYLQQLNVNPERRAETFELLRQRIELDDKLHALTTGETNIVEGVYESPGQGSSTTED